MAVMTPATPPPDEQGTKAERTAYLAFEDQLPDEFYVYYSLELVTADAQEAEIDFLIVHPELGLLVIECKGGGVERDVHGQWVRKHGARVDRLDESPWEQAARHQHGLIGELTDRMRQPASGFLGHVRQHNGFPFCYGRAAAFPFAEAEEANLPLDANAKIFFDASDFDNLEPAVRRAMDFWKGRRDKATMDDEELRRFRHDVLYPTTSLAESLAARIRAEDRAFERLSREQVQVIRSLKDRKRLLVEGGAGSGKSLLALEAARMLAKDGMRVLLTCFNRKLRSSLDRKIDRAPDAAGGIEVNHFHGLCRAAIEASEAQVEYPDRADKEKSRQFWEEEAPYLLFEALEGGRLDGWDAIVVDEAQDFAAEWWDILQAGLRGGADGRLVALQDPSQDLFDRHNELPDFDVTLPLTRNFRNTTEIQKVVDQLYQGAMQSHPRTPDGEPPRVERYSGREAQLAAIDELVAELLGQQDLDPSQLAVLTPRTKPNSVLADCEALGGVPVTDRFDESDEKLLHSSIGGFKGLERDVVVFADVDPDHPRCSPNARYVAASRAVNRLYVFEKSDWLGDL